MVRLVDLDCSKESNTKGLMFLIEKLVGTDKRMSEVGYVNAMGDGLISTSPARKLVEPDYVSSEHELAFLGAVVVGG